MKQNPGKFFKLDEGKIAYDERGRAVIKDTMILNLKTGRVVSKANNRAYKKAMKDNAAHRKKQVETEENKQKYDKKKSDDMTKMKQPSQPTSKSYYKIINGVKYDRTLCDLAEHMAGDTGILTQSQMQEVIKATEDGSGTTDIEKASINYLRAKYMPLAKETKKEEVREEEKPYVVKEENKEEEKEEETKEEETKEEETKEEETKEEEQRPPRSFKGSKTQNIHHPPLVDRYFQSRDLFFEASEDARQSLRETPTPPDEDISELCSVYGLGVYYELGGREEWLELRTVIAKKMQRPGATETKGDVGGDEDYTVGVILDIQDLDMDIGQLKEMLMKYKKGMMNLEARDEKIETAKKVFTPNARTLNNVTVEEPTAGEKPKKREGFDLNEPVPNHPTIQRQSTTYENLGDEGEPLFGGINPQNFEPDNFVQRRNFVEVPTQREVNNEGVRHRFRL